VIVAHLGGVPVEEVVSALVGSGAGLVAALARSLARFERSEGRAARGERHEAPY
jgi:hypothetical protein